MIRSLALPAFALLFGLQSAAPILGGRLKPGMQLVYSSGGVDTPWLVLAVNGDTSIAASAGRCLSLRLRINPNDSTVTSRLQCVEGAQMHSWNAGAARLMPARPFQGKLEMRGAAGGSVHYATSPAEVDTVSGQAYVVIPTVVETLDAEGKLVRRLRERFAIELATATCGVFEVPEGTGFRAERIFVLAAVLNPGEIPRVPDANQPSARPPTPKC